jgi:hypothetical protein
MTSVDLSNLLGTVLVTGVALKTVDYLFREQKKKNNKKLESLWK